VQDFVISHSKNDETAEFEIMSNNDEQWLPLFLQIVNKIVNKKARNSFLNLSVD